MPSIKDVTATNLSISIKWTAGSDDGDFPDIYNVSCNHTLSGTTSELSHTISDLQPYTVYSVCIKAFNRLGVDSNAACTQFKTKQGGMVIHFIFFCLCYFVCVNLLICEFYY